MQMILAVVILLFIVRIAAVFYQIYHNRKLRKTLGAKRRGDPVKCMFVAGSGGHTKELLTLVSSLEPSIYTPRCYVVAQSDEMSSGKVDALQRELMHEDYTLVKIPRSREVRQSWISSALTSLHACIMALPIVFSFRPQLLLVNGPGTCIPVCLAAFLLTILGHKVQIVFVESVCRVQSVSLTGKILYYLADVMIVNWPELQRKYPTTTYMGRVV